MLTKLSKEYFTPVLTKLYSLINLQKIKYQIINQPNHLDELLKTKHYVIAHFQGNNFLFFMCMINNKKFNIFISKKELKYFVQQNILNDLKLYTIDCNLDIPNSYYNNTLLDGKIISDKNIYNIYEVYYMEGNNVQNINLKIKLDNLNLLINKIKIKEQIIFKICKLYDYSEVPDLLFNKLKISELKINGLIFLPEFSNKYYIYTNDQEFEDLKHKNVIQKSISNKKENEFFMKKTNLPDVYELYDDLNKKSKSIAHIPNIKTSHYFRTIFKDKNIVKVNCLKSEKFKKWIPLCDDYLDYSDIIF